jgi:hypothetical protein
VFKQDIVGKSGSVISRDKTKCSVAQLAALVLHTHYEELGAAAGNQGSWKRESGMEQAQVVCGPLPRPHQAPSWFNSSTSSTGYSTGPPS